MKDKMLAAVTKSLAAEAAKPASKAIDALIAPKINRLKRWAADRDLEGRLTEESLAKVFDPYLRRLLKRVAGVNTIVFPQQVLPLQDIYEPLHLKARYGNAAVKESALRAPGARTYLVDGGGMGKSTFARHLVLEELREHDLLPILFELRRVASGEHILEAVAKEIDELDRVVDRDLLMRLFSVGRFLLILDGFDEVAESERPRVAREIEEIATKSPECSVVVTARPEAVLPELPEASIVEFRPLTRDSSISLIRRYDKVAEIDVGEGLIERLSDVPPRFLETPLLVALLYKTYGYNGSVSDRASVFYDEMYSALYKGHDLTKSGFSREKSSSLDVEGFRRLLRAMCFLMLAREVVGFRGESEAVALIEQASKLASVSTDASNYLSDLLLAVPLLVREGNELRFIHKTISEFFAAEYISYAGGSDGLLKKIIGGVSAERFADVIDWLADVNLPLYKRIVAAPLAERVLAHRPAGQEPRMRALTFFQDIQLAVLPSEILKSHGPRIPLPEAEVDLTATVFYRIQPEANTLIGVGVPSGARVPYAAWEMITEPCNSGDESIDFSKLAEVLPLNQWVSVHDELLKNHELLKNPATATAVSAISHDVLRSTALFIGRGPTSRQVRVLSDERCHLLLQEIETEAEARKLLDEVLDRS